MTAYLDASVVVPLLVDEQGSRFAVDYIYSYGGDLVVSDFAAAEVASAVSRLLRMGQLDRRRAEVALDDFDRLRSSVLRPAELINGDLRRADALVRRLDLELRAPDAIHLATARRLEATLVTLDRKMAKAARALGFLVEPPE